MQNLTLPTQLAGTLLPFGVELSSPKNSSCEASISTHGGPEGLVQQCSNQLGGMQHFSPPRELSWGSLYLHLLLTWYLGSSWSLKRPPMGAASSTAASLMGVSVEAGWALPGTVVLAQSLRNPSSGATPSRTVSSKKETVPLHHLPQFEDTLLPRGMVGLA